MAILLWHRTHPPPRTYHAHSPVSCFIMLRGLICPITWNWTLPTPISSSDNILYPFWKWVNWALNCWMVLGFRMVSSDLWFSDQDYILLPPCKGVNGTEKPPLNCWMVLGISGHLTVFSGLDRWCPEFTPTSLFSSEFVGLHLTHHLCPPVLPATLPFSASAYSCLR